MHFYDFARKVVEGIYRLCFRIQIEGRENIPKEGAYVVCANHTSNLDPPMLGVCLPVRLRYMAKEELFQNRFFGGLIRALGAFPIRRGKSDVGALRAAVKMLRGGEWVVVFPEGGRSHGDFLRKGKQGAALIAAMAGVDILPVGICGSYQPFRKMVVRFGKPISMQQFREHKPSSEELQRITDEQIMPMISMLSGVKTYENRNC